MRRPFQPASPKLPMPVVAPAIASQAMHLEPGLEVIVKAVVSAYAERGLEPTREEIHAVATATITATTAVMRAAIDTALELRAALK